MKGVKEARAQVETERKKADGIGASLEATHRAFVEAGQAAVDYVHSQAVVCTICGGRGGAHRVKKPVCPVSKIVGFIVMASHEEPKEPVSRSRIVRVGTC